MGGVVIAADPGEAEFLSSWANVTGVTGAPFDAYLTLRGLRTLFPRMERQQRTASALASWLERHPKVSARSLSRSAFPPRPRIAEAQQTGFGAMLSFELAGDLADLRRFVEAVQGFTLAESLGGVESLIAHPATMTHASMDETARRVAGIGDRLLRLSVGLESRRISLADSMRLLGARLINPITGAFSWFAARAAMTSRRSVRISSKRFVTSRGPRRPRPPCGRPRRATARS